MPQSKNIYSYSVIMQSVHCCYGTAFGKDQEGRRCASFANKNASGSQRMFSKSNLPCHGNFAVRGCVENFKMSTI